MWWDSNPWSVFNQYIMQGALTIRSKPWEGLSWSTHIEHVWLKCWHFEYFLQNIFFLKYSKKRKCSYYLLRPVSDMQLEPSPIYIGSKRSQQGKVSFYKSWLKCFHYWDFMRVPTPPPQQGNLDIFNLNSFSFSMFTFNFESPGGENSNLAAIYMLRDQYFVFLSGVIK